MLFIMSWLPCWLSGKEPTCQWRGRGFDPWVGKIPGEGNGNPLQCSCLENPMVREPNRQQSMGWQMSWTRLKD